MWLVQKFPDYQSVTGASFIRCALPGDQYRLQLPNRGVDYIDEIEKSLRHGATNSEAPMPDGAAVEPSASTRRRTGLIGQQSPTPFPASASALLIRTRNQDDA